MIFGLFGIKVLDDFSVEIKPHLPAGIKRMSLKNIHLSGKIIDVVCSEKSFFVRCDGSVIRGEYQSALILNN